MFYIRGINTSNSIVGFIGLTSEAWVVPASIFLPYNSISMITTRHNPPSDFDKYDEPRLHMERLLKARLVEFDLSGRLLILLEKGGIKTLGDLVGHSRKSLSAIKNIGVNSVEIIVGLLNRLGLSLAGE